MKKILFITAFPPNQRTAGQDYSRRLIFDLVNKNFEVSLIYAEYPGHEVELPNAVQILKFFKPSVFHCLKKLGFHPFFTKRYDSQILRYIKERAHKFDVLYFDFSQIHIYSNYVPHPFKILMCHDVVFQKYMRRGGVQLPWIKKTEGSLLKTARHVIAFSSKDCILLERIYGVDAQRVNFYLKTGKFNYLKEYIGKEDSFCFYGAWNRSENYEALEWFIDTVYPKLIKKYKFKVIGGDLSDSMKKIIERTGDFQYLGFVNNPIAEIAKSVALIAPLKKGAGVKVKVIDALSSGTPVIGSDVAFEGIEDNINYKLFYRCATEDDYISVLENWTKKEIGFRQIAADEFFSRYNANHLPDLLESMIK